MILRGPDREALLSEKYNARAAVKRRCRKRVTRRARRRGRGQGEGRRGDERGGGKGEEGGERVSASARSSVDDCTTFRGYGRGVSWRVSRNGGRGDSLVPHRTPLSLSLFLARGKLGKNKNTAPPLRPLRYPRALSHLEPRRPVGRARGLMPQQEEVLRGSPGPLLCAVMGPK